MKIKLAIYVCVLLSAACSSAQQLGDTSYTPHIEKPTFSIGEGPVVKIDEAHHNFHTMDGRYSAFAKVLRHDGYRVQANTSEFNRDSLNTCDILVISNALNEKSIDDWSSTPSAFTDIEIEVVRKWVEDGGAMFLIADHMPFPGAAEELAGVFGFDFSNGFAFSTMSEGPDVFRRSDGSLRTHEITNGKEPGGRLDSVVTFTGQAFTADRDHQPIIVFDSSFVGLMPAAPWEFEQEVDTLHIAGWMQAAAANYGKGRVFVSGEAAMFTAQMGSGGFSVGLTSPEAEQNQRYLRNIMCWLSGCFD
jgi:hypothetical protein